MSKKASFKNLLSLTTLTLQQRFVVCATPLPPLRSLLFHLAIFCFFVCMFVCSRDVCMCVFVGVCVRVYVKNAVEEEQWASGKSFESDDGGQAYAQKL